jgi:hypothetical protein
MKTQYQPQPRNYAAQIAHHKTDFDVCSQTAHECRKWASIYLEAATVYEQAANNALTQLAITLQSKWANGGAA